MGVGSGHLQTRIGVERLPQLQAQAARVLSRNALRSISSCTLASGLSATR
jgi:hypothetical protein